MSKEEIKEMSYLDIAYTILKNQNKEKTTPELFKEVCKILDICDKYESFIGDFYTALVVDKRFVILDNKWRLKEKVNSAEIKARFEDEEDLDTDDIIEEIDEEEDEEDLIEETPDEEEDLIEETPEEEELEENIIPFEEEDLEDDEEN